MKDVAAVLSAGPSLRRTWPCKARHGVVIAINMAAVYYRCDWYVASDEKAYKLFPYQPSPAKGYASCGKAILDYRAGDLAGMHEGLETYHWPSLPFYHHTLSLPLALCLVAHLGFKKAHLFGVDWKGTEDFLGSNPRQVSSRSDQRWKNEEHDTTEIARHFGLELTRVFP